MASKLSDTFNSPIWQDWDSNAQFAASEAYLSAVAQQHIDLRTFQQTDMRIPKPQSITDLLEQSDVTPDGIANTLDDLVQSQIESTTGIQGEAWAKTGSGFTSFAVAKVASYKNWKALQAVTTGAAISTDFISSMTQAISILGMDSLSIVFPDWHAFDNTSYVQLTSNPTGAFGTAAYDSAHVTFTGGLAEERHFLSGFTSGAGVSFSLASITGVKVHIDKAVAPAASLTFTMMAMRAIKTGWVYSNLDFDTRVGQLVTAPTLDGTDPASAIPLFRGTGAGDDPRPTDATLQVNLIVGSGTIATGSNYNRIDCRFRENDNASFDTWIRATLRFNSTKTWIDFYADSWDDGGMSLTSTLIVSQQLFTDASVAPFGSQTGLTALVLTPTDNNVDPLARNNDAGRYQFEANLTGQAITVRLFSMTSGGTIDTQVWPNHFQDNSVEDAINLAPVQGRIGLYGLFLDRDAALDAFTVSETGFANLTTKVYASLTPVDGAQLQAAYADDLNLFTDFFAPDLFRDPTKTLSDVASYRSAATVVTNQFAVDDWDNTYLELDLFVPVGDSGDNWLTFFSGSTQYTLSLGSLAANTWNHIQLDLDLFRAEATGRFWQFIIGWPNDSGGYFWIANMKIGRRQVAWQVKANVAASFRDFRSLVNDPDGAVHFPQEERGNSLQLVAKALTQDAWIAGFVLIPRYAQLGAPLYMHPDPAL